MERSNRQDERTSATLSTFVESDVLISQDQFEHEPLDLTQAGNVRLLRLESQQDDQNIHCSIACDLSIHDTDYAAVSYEWGESTTQPYKILIDGKAFGIRQNLHRFLSSLVAQGYTEQLLWIDAVCIDQHSPLEKNHQVAQMGEIYRNATNVFIWLGQAADESDQAFDFIQELQIPVRDRSSSVSSLLALTQDDWNAVRFSMYDVSFSPRRVVLSDSIRAVCDRSYWQRQWIVQEVRLARNAVLFCGLKRCEWLPFSVAMEAGWSESRFSAYWNERLRKCLAISLLEDWTLRVESNAPDSLQSLLLRYCSCLCADPRDKIYALLNLAGSTTVQVNYALTPVEVFTDALQTFKSPLNFQQLQNLLSSVDVTLVELVECWISRREHPMKQIIVDIGANDAAKPFMADNETLSPDRGAMNHQRYVQPNSLGPTAKKCTHTLYEFSDLFIFRDHIRNVTRVLDTAKWAWAGPNIKSLANKRRIKVCDCVSCKSSRQQFLELSKYPLPSPDQDLSGKDGWVWLEELSTIHFTRAVEPDESDVSIVRTYCGSAVILADADGRFSHRRSLNMDVTDKELYLLLYWDHTLSNMEYTLSRRTSENPDPSVSLNTGQMHVAVAHQRHTTHAEPQEQHCPCGEYTLPLSKLRDVCIAPD